jgi:hypothetical protein
MLAIEKLELQDKLFQLEKNIELLKKEIDILNFCTTLINSEKLLSSMVYHTRNKRQLFRIGIPQTLLINIMLFLPFFQIRICQTVCKNWLNIYKNKLINDILLNYLSKKLCHSHSFVSPFQLLFSLRRDNDLFFIKESGQFCRLADHDLKLYISGTIDTDIKEISNITSNKQYFCVYNSKNMIIFTNDLDKKFTLSTNTYFNDIIIYKNFVYILEENNIEIYNLNGIIKKKIFLDNLKVRKIFPYKNEIFLIENYSIKVISEDNKLLRFWGEEGRSAGCFKDIKGIKIYKKIVYVIDSGNHRIQAFTLNGDFILKYNYDTQVNITDIFCINNYIYLTGKKERRIIRLEIKNDY